MSLVSRYLDASLAQRLNQLQLSARSVVVGSVLGAHRSPLKGLSIDFRQHRFYVPGDELRRLDWRVLGRTDRLYVKEYDEETNLRCMLMLDGSASMAYGARRGSKFDHAARLVASLAYLTLARTESVGVGIFGKTLTHYLPPHSGSGQLSRIISVLERTSPRGAALPAAAMHTVAERLERRALVIVVSDMYAPVPTLREGLARLRHDRHELIVIQVTDPDETQFPFQNWVRFRGLEGERPVLCETAIMRKTYLENFHRHQQELAESCRRLGVELYRYSTDRPLIEWLTRFLQQRSAGR